MATYVKDFKGYIADVPIAYFTRCDKRRFTFDKLTAASVTPQMNPMDINAGWSLYPVATLPGQATFEMQITSGEFNAELFAMANATEYTKSNFGVPQTEWVAMDAQKKITLKHTPNEGTVSIKGLNASDQTPDFTVDGNEITFTTADDQIMEISYEFDAEMEQVLIDNKSSAIGECTLEYPVYSSGEDCTEASIIGYYYVRVFRARITAVPGFDASYKQAQTYQFTLTALDASHLRNDEYCYACAYKEGNKKNW